MSLSYRARKRLSKLVDRHAEDVEATLLEAGEGEAIAKIASNAVYDALLQDDQLGEIISIAHSAEQLADDRGRPSEDEIGNSIEAAWLETESAIEARAKELREEIVEDVVSREAMSA